MLPVSKRLAIFFAAALLNAPSARALIIYGSGPSDVNNTLNTTAPTTGLAAGAPWYNVVQFGPHNASAVYLGYGYVLTANHVGLEDTGIVVNGVSYNRDTAFAPVQVTEDVPTTAFADFADLKLVKILGNPVLPQLPVVQKLPINYSTTNDLSTSSTLIGWGVGKGSVVLLKGWNGGADTTRAERWGTNSAPLSDTIVSFPNYGYTYDAFRLDFNRNLGASTAHIAFGDSGSALFQKIGGVWKLSGTDTLAEAAYYDYDLLTPGDQPDSCYFVRLEKYAHLLRYENWANTKLGSPIAAEAGDPDHDGLNNLLEYAFHTNPNTASTSALPQVGMEGGFVTLTYTQLMSATDLSYAVEESPSLSPANWNPATVIEETVSIDGVTRVVKAKVAIGAATQKFLRLSVKKLP